MTLIVLRSVLVYFDFFSGGEIPSFVHFWVHVSTLVHVCAHTHAEARDRPKGTKYVCFSLGTFFPQILPSSLLSVSLEAYTDFK